MIQSSVCPKPRSASLPMSVMMAASPRARSVPNMPWMVCDLPAPVEPLMSRCIDSSSRGKATPPIRSPRLSGDKSLRIPTQPNETSRLPRTWYPRDRGGAR